MARQSCRSCRAPIAGSDSFCPGCGLPLEPQRAARALQVRRLAIPALLLAVLAAAIGGWRYWEYRRALDAGWPRTAALSGGCGLIDRSGTFVVNPEYEAITIFSGGEWVAVTKDGKTGFIDSAGTAKTALRWEAAFPPVKGTDSTLGAPVIIEKGRFGFIADGGRIVPPSFLPLEVDADGEPQPAVAMLDFDRHGAALVFTGDEKSPQPVFIGRSGETLIGLEPYDSARPFDGGEFAPVRDRQSGKWGLINRKGEVVLSPRFDAIGRVGTAQTAFVRTGSHYRLILPSLRVAGPKIDALPYEWQRTPLFDKQSPVPVKIGTKWGYVDKEGRPVISPQFDEAGPFFDNPLANVRMGDGWGYVERSGRLRINPRFDKAYPFIDGWGPVAMGGKWGFVRLSGELIEPRYAGFKIGGEGLAAVQVGQVSDRTSSWIGDMSGRTFAAFSGDGKWGFIDTKGRLAIPARYESVEAFGQMDLAPVKRDGRWGFADAEGQEVVPPQFDQIDRCADPGG